MIGSVIRKCRIPEPIFFNAYCVGISSARDTVDGLNTLRHLKDLEIEVYFVKENIWTLDAKGELMITIMSSLAQEESRSISENTTWGKRKQFADGKGSVAFGCFLGYDKDIKINEEQAATVRLIYRLFISGLSLYAITKELENWGIKPEECFLAGANDMEYCIENDKKMINHLKPGAKSGYESSYVLGCNTLYDFEVAFIFNTAIMNKVAYVLDDDFYISPVCTDNVVVTPVGLWKGTDKMAELHANIRELTAEMEEYRTKLPEQLMMYSRELGEVVGVTEEEKGQMAG